ncbi:MAG: pyridoxal phosphate-dependent aminotransferase family protein [Chitinophagaceae bacterium]|nr:pyridoxal phosphate-dependent aminotransferase family protein [Chitinophagaceae bacterium]
MYNDDFLDRKLEERREQNTFRKLRDVENKIDFCSNDYLGIVHKGLLNTGPSHSKHGSTGSRLLTGNSYLTEMAEEKIAAFHKGQAAVIFNSGYDANVGLLSCIAQKGDTIIYDQLVHASIRDGIRLSYAQSFSFAHNNIEDLEKKLIFCTGNIFVVTESVFSMDGDVCPLSAILSLVKIYNAHLILDEAHAIGVVGANGEGLSQSLNLHEQCFARVYTFGKACGCHGAVAVGSTRLKDYLINFARSFIFSTALPEVAIHAIINSYEVFPLLCAERGQLQILIEQFQSTSTKYTKLISKTPIQGIIVPGNNVVKEIAANLNQNNFDVRPILYPTVPKGTERLRIILHANNLQHELQQLLQLLA